jgi:hypothetical protein
MAEPLTIAVVAIGAVMTPLQGGPFPNMPIIGATPQIEQIYKDGNRYVSSPILNPDSADRACPAGYEIRRQSKREDGSKVYLVWTLACR